MWKQASRIPLYFRNHWTQSFCPTSPIRFKRFTWDGRASMRAKYGSDQVGLLKGHIWDRRSRNYAQPLHWHVWMLIYYTRLFILSMWDCYLIVSAWPGALRYSNLYSSNWFLTSFMEEKRHNLTCFIPILFIASHFCTGIFIWYVEEQLSIIYISPTQNYATIFFQNYKFRTCHPSTSHRFLAQMRILHQF